MSDDLARDISRAEDALLRPLGCLVGVAIYEDATLPPGTWRMANSEAVKAAPDVMQMLRERWAEQQEAQP